MEDKLSMNKTNVNLRSDLKKTKDDAQKQESLAKEKIARLVSAK